VRLRRLFRIGALALAALLLAGCGSAHTSAKVEAGLRQYISGLPPQEGAFPIDAGPPRVMHNGCKDRRVTTKSGTVYHFHSAAAYLPAGLALWSCVVTFRHGLTLPVAVAVTDSKVVAVFPGASANGPRQSPPTVYEGG
jgi:hypothetical protein